MNNILKFVFIFLIQISAYSQKDTITEKSDVLSLEELMKAKISSVSKNNENILETPQTIIVITKEQLLQRGYTDLEQVFHDLPGFDISRGNGTQYSQIYQRGYRSNNTEKTVFMIDGVEENDLWSNSVWLSRQYPLTYIERIEVVYGPSATIYGANAFLGVINIITKEPDNIISNETGIALNSHFAYGTWNTQYVDISFAAKSKEVSLLLAGRYFRSDEMNLSKYEDWDYSLDNYNEEFYSNILGTDNSTIVQKAIDYDRTAYYQSSELKGLTPRFSNSTNDYLIYGKLKISHFTLGFQTFQREEGYGAWYRDDFELGTDFDTKWIPKNSFFYTKYSKNISKKLTLTSFANYKIHQLAGDCEELYFRGYFNKELGLTNIADTIGTGMNLLPKDSIEMPYWWRSWWHTYSQQARIELRMNYNPGKKINLNFGVEFRSSHIQGAYSFSETSIPEESAIVNNTNGGNHFFSRDFGFFMQTNYNPFKNVNIVVGGRIDNNKIRVTGGYGTVFNPKAALILTPSNFTFKAIYSEAFMDAGYWTKYGTTPGRLLDNPFLKPEKVKNFEFSVGWFSNKNLYADLVTYQSFYSDAVGTVDVSFVDEEGNTVYTTQHQPIGTYSVQGIQSNLYFDYRQYSSYLNYTFTNPNKTDEEKIRVGDIASHQINLGVNVLYFKKLNINLRANWVGDKPTGINTTISKNPNNRIDAYFVLNGAIKYKIIKVLSIQFLVNNIFDTEYFHPGVRSGNGILYASKLPQNTRNITAKIIIDI